MFRNDQMSRLRRRRQWVLAAAVAATLATPAAAAAVPAERQHPTHQLKWEACTDPAFTGKQCGTIRVPMDWSQPRGAHLTLALVRQPALDPAHRIGTLLINNGRGLSAIEQFRYALEGLTQIGGAMPRRFDLVAVDNRGVGHSTPIRCAEPLKPAGISYFPQSKAAFDKLVAHNRTLGQDCVRRNGSLVAHMDQAGTARDLDAVRVAPGDCSNAGTVRTERTTPRAGRRRGGDGRRGEPGRADTDRIRSARLRRDQ
ncbi:hypothetical protein Misp01_66890 [Microtetraspora sp. NBRC 13810]|uniref:hypothetical protein n=1 Tax=Microtetraspora sp. NBRC 13810 TaxID=3030990 RepID=UPI0024A1302F|nr:hypothetical protein [Microtetraspora sp. NBRC 13810]GLW11561.1 hypothetical protein Misp01_66890 [Microtetraspora sp. NBRC 13810]